MSALSASWHTNVLEKTKIDERIQSLNLTIDATFNIQDIIQARYVLSEHILNLLRRNSDWETLSQLSGLKSGQRLACAPSGNHSFIYLSSLDGSYPASRQNLPVASRQSLERLIDIFLSLSPAVQIQLAQVDLKNLMISAATSGNAHLGNSQGVDEDGNASGLEQDNSGDSFTVLF